MERFYPLLPKVVGPTRFELVSIAPEATSLDQLADGPTISRFFRLVRFMLFVGLALTLAVWRVEPALESIYKGGGRLAEQQRPQDF